jgi:hypothetical protein
MELRYKTFIMPHVGDSYSQCADRFAIGTDKNCFAIADGVGESLFPYDWAELVCEDFIANPNLFCENNKLVRENALIEAWNQKRDERTANLTETELFLFEMGLEKADFAACTFVGLSIDKKQWQSLALGDSYLFVLDKNLEIIESVASQKGEEFSNFPEYFASQAEKNHGKTIKVCGDINKVTYFVLLTDAISDWFIKVDTEKRKELLAISDMQSFHSLVNKERENGNMKDDDTTAVIIEVVHDDSDDIKYTKLYNTNINDLIEEEEKCLKLEDSLEDMENDSFIKNDTVEKKTIIEEIDGVNAVSQPIELAILPKENTDTTINSHSITSSPIEELTNKLRQYIDDFIKLGDELLDKIDYVKSQDTQNRNRWDKVGKSVKKISETGKTIITNLNKIKK